MTDTPVPATPRDIAPPWLEDALSSRYPGVRVSSIDVTELRQVTNTHAHLVVEYEERNGAPTDFFCKMLPLDPARREVVAASRMGTKEVLFYDRVARDLPLRPLLQWASHPTRTSACRRAVSRTAPGGSHPIRQPQHWKTSRRSTSVSKTGTDAKPTRRGRHLPRQFRLRDGPCFDTVSTTIAIG